MPVAFIMGVDVSECHTVGRLIGIKTVANEFIAYRELGLLIETQSLSPRAAIICTYALCGFANPGSIGVQLATLGSLAPERKSDVAKVILRAFVGNYIITNYIWNKTLFLGKKDVYKNFWFFLYLYRYMIKCLDLAHLSETSHKENVPFSKNISYLVFQA